MSLFSQNPSANFSPLKDANFYFYFGENDRKTAVTFQRIFRAQGYETRLSWFEYGKGQWSLILNKQLSGLDEAIEIDEAFRVMAEARGINYDGHEVEL